MPHAMARTAALAARSLALLTLLSAAAWAMGPKDLPGGACAGKELACAKAATPLMLPDGSMLLAWTAGGSVSVARSTDLGHSFGPAVVLDPEAKIVDNGPDARPKIVIDTAGRLTVAYSIFKDEHWNAQVLVAHSADNGASFSKPQPIGADPASQRFEALQALPSGEVFAAWLDKRDEAAAKKAGQAYAGGAALAYAVSKDGGATFTEARIAQDNTCECCRLAIALTPAGLPAVLFRNTYDDGQVRDHAVTTFDAKGRSGPVYRVSVDEYRINGCPHHGPSLAISADGTYHAAWFTNGSVRKGLFYARSSDGGQRFSTPMLLAGPDRQAARPFVLATPEGIWLAWKEFDGERTLVRTKVSHDDGKTWSATDTVAATTDESDHPLLVSNGHGTFLSWMTRKEGYRLIPLGQSS